MPFTPHPAFSAHAGSLPALAALQVEVGVMTRADNLTDAVRVPGGYAHVDCGRYEYPTCVPPIAIAGDSAVCVYCDDPIGNCAPEQVYIPRQWVGRAVNVMIFLAILFLAVIAMVVTA